MALTREQINKITEAVHALRPGAEFAVSRVDGSISKWVHEQVVPTNTEVLDKIVEQDAERAAEEATYQQAAINKAIVQGRADIRALIRMSPAEIDNWIDNNVTSLGEARTLFKRLTNVVAILAEREFR